MPRFPFSGHLLMTIGARARRLRLAREAKAAAKGKCPDGQAHSPDPDRLYCTKCGNPLHDTSGLT